MKKQGLFFSFTLLLFLSTALLAEEHFLYGSISAYEKNDVLLKQSGVSISIEVPANINSRDISITSGKFKLGLKQLKSGESIVLAVEKKDDNRHWAMLHPYKGKVRIPDDLVNDVIEVVMVPADSHKRKSETEMQLIIQQAAAKQAVQGNIRPDQQPQNWQQQLAKLAQQKGIPEQQFIDDIDAFVNDVLTQPNEYNEETKAYADYANKNFPQAEKGFATLAEQYKEKRKQEQKTVENRDKKIIESLKMAGLAANSDRNYQQALAHFNDALTYTNQQKDALIWAKLQISLADAHQQFAAQTSGKAIAEHFTQASNAYQQALQVYTREKLPQQWAMTQNNLGISLKAQGVRTGGKQGQQLLAEAVTAYRQALEVRTREKLPQKWAMTQNNLANTLTLQQQQGSHIGDRQRQQLLMEAITIYRLALEVYTRKQLPQDWAMTQNNLANTLQQQGSRTGGKQGQQLLAEAVIAYRLALQVYTRKQLPQDWAMTQNNLALTLQEQGIRTGSKKGQQLLSEAVTTYRLALQVRTRKQLPQDWAMTQNNLATALQKHGSRTGGKQGQQLLIEAVTAYRLALQVRTRKQLPHQWAMTQNNLAITLKEQGSRTDGKQGQQLLTEAVAAFQLALQVYTRKQLPQQWAVTQNNLANALHQQGIRIEGQEGKKLLIKAIKHYRLALEVYTKKHMAYYWKIIRNSLATALNTLAYDLITNPLQLKHAREMLLEAVEIDPKQPSYRDSLGWAEYYLGHLGKAEKLLQQAFDDLKQPNPEVASHLITVLWKRNKPQEAKQLLAKMLKEYPKDKDLLVVDKLIKKKTTLQ